MLGVGAGGPPADPEGGVGPDAGPISVDDRIALATLASAQGVGPVTLAGLIATIGRPSTILEVAAADGGSARLREAIAGLGDRVRPHAQSTAAAIVDATGRREAILRRVDGLGLRLLALGDPDYPVRLRAIEFPPQVLFVRGEPRAFATEHAIAIVGTRRPSDAGRRIASRIAGAIARTDGLVISGLAVGIDGAAHAAAVSEGRPTVAFIGSGHGQLFPPVHDRLADAIVEAGGAIASEHPPDTIPSKGTFPQRNRLISGASDAVVVVEAGARSGALITASWALEQGRECFLVPGPIEAPESAGCLGFLREFPGAARVVAGVPQLLEDLGMPGLEGLPARRSARVVIRSSVRGPSPTAALATLPESDRAVAAAVVDGAAVVDEIVASTRLPIGNVLGALSRLEAAGVVVGRHGRYRLSDRIAGAAA